MHPVTPLPVPAPFRADPGSAAHPATLFAPRTLTSNQLLRGDKEVQIEHHGAVYRLRLTALGKLILTK
ncbi:MAG: hemin uptake protein HemP [Proteobacteria bacterium]|nr:hemin uptake protein HemP [Pseudomonadota bacterium]